MNRMHELLQNLADRGLTLGCVESMTGGAFAAEVTSVPGASNVFKGGIVSYSAELKTKLVGINPKDIEDEGVVSQRIAAEMARLGRKVLGVDVVLSVTGNAGPTAEEGEAPVGKAYFGLATKDGVWAFGYDFEGERNVIRAKAVELMINFGLSQFPKVAQ